MLAKLTRLGISCGATPSQLRSAREHFEQHNYLRLPGFIEPGLLRVIDITAIIFRVAEHLEHRVTPIEGKVPKTAISGWFCSRPRYTSVHRDLIARSESAIATSAIRRQKNMVFPSPYDVVKIPRAVVSQTAGRETFVANIGTATCYGLNQTGGRIWELLAQGHGMRSIAVTIAGEYGVPRKDVERDVLALAYKLAQRGLLKIVHAPSPRSVHAPPRHAPGGRSSLAKRSSTLAVMREMLLS
jgi:hypothetical protein